MGLSFGWKSNDTRESIWKDDNSLVNVPESALVSWRVDGDASHLRPFATNGQASKITFRTLNSDEYLAVTTRHYGAGSIESYSRMTLLGFRIAVDFPDAPNEFTDARGVRQLRVVKEQGTAMLSDGFVRHIEETYPGIVLFYGNLVLQASMPTPAEKKASSPPSIQSAYGEPTAVPLPGAAA